MVNDWSPQGAGRFKGGRKGELREPQTPLSPLPVAGEGGEDRRSEPGEGYSGPPLPPAFAALWRAPSPRFAGRGEEGRCASLAIPSVSPSSATRIGLSSIAANACTSRSGAAFASNATTDGSTGVLRPAPGTPRNNVIHRHVERAGDLYQPPGADAVHGPSRISAPAGR
jgi:hypothetical protein